MSLLQNGMAVRTDKVTPTRHHHNAWHRAGTQRTLLPFHFSLSFLNLFPVLASGENILSCGVEEKN